MKLTQAQIEAFERDGYLFFPALLARHPRVVQCLPDDCLLKNYDVALPWKDGTPPEELQGSLKAA